MAQMDLFPQAVVAESPVPSVESVRARFERMLNVLRNTATDPPMTARELAFWEVVTPQMANWLPPEERAAVCGEFATHLARLKKAA